jgi:hypothetical protein
MQCAPVGVEAGATRAPDKSTSTVAGADCVGAAQSCEETLASMAVHSAAPVLMSVSHPTRTADLPSALSLRTPTPEAGTGAAAAPLLAI